MLRSLFSGVSGLKNHQTRMDVIGNNISNVNTTGFKSSRVTFSDTLSQTMTGAAAATEGKGGTNPKQIGLGSQVSSVDLLFTDGSVQSTGKNTDLCLSGSGLFVVKNGNGTYYTRNGAFSFDEQGNYVTSDGSYVQGWTAIDGTLDTNGTPGNITIPAGKSMEAKSTTNVDYVNNLDSAAPMITSITYVTKKGESKSVDPGASINVVGADKAKADDDIISATIALSDGTTKSVNQGRFTDGHSMPISTTVTVYDSLGNAHAVPILIEKTATPNNWVMSLAPTGYNDSADGKTTYVKEADGSFSKWELDDAKGITFTEDGAYDSTNPDNADVALKFTSVSEKEVLGDGSEITNGSKPTTISVKRSALTQYSGSSTINASADGNAAGTLSSISVDSSGIITGTYTNGIVRSEAQVAVAQFNNSAGLTKVGGSYYQESNNSGVPNIKTAAKLGVSITPSALEMSNVDIADQFSDMIITQRGFQSNSKIITVSDEILETLINMKR
jgi:flagellar hook protein FlgE